MQGDQVCCRAGNVNKGRPYRLILDGYYDSSYLSAVYFVFMRIAFMIPSAQS